jgi:hypothetical protein
MRSPRSFLSTLLDGLTGGALSTIDVRHKAFKCAITATLLPPLQPYCYHHHSHTAAIIAATFTALAMHGEMDKGLPLTSCHFVRCSKRLCCHSHDHDRLCCVHPQCGLLQHGVGKDRHRQDVEDLLYKSDRSNDKLIQTKISILHHHLDNMTTSSHANEINDLRSLLTVCLTVASSAMIAKRLQARKVIRFHRDRREIAFCLEVEFHLHHPYLQQPSMHHFYDHDCYP